VTPGSDELDEPDELIARARAWLAEDPDPATRAELERMLAAPDHAALVDCFASRLQFGTAGLRGPLGAGPNRMNRALVRRAAAGLARYLKAQPRRGPAPSVIVGYDARHRSEEFAAEAAAVLAGAGLPASLMPRALPTPLLAYAVTRLGAAAGVMITASHNPAGDNGLKVYLGDGAQIVHPVDQRVSAEIDAVTSLRGVPLAPVGEVKVLDEGIVNDYLGQAEKQSLTPSSRNVDIVYTPLHGVGGSVALRLLDGAGFEGVAEVAEQGKPDPEFPTVAFPNPEEPGALDLAIALAARRQADLVLANDPDADRLGAAVPNREQTGWQILRGDEIGVLLADHILRHTSGDDRLVATTIVSSSLLARMAEAEGVHYAETLTGFKWIVRAAFQRPDLRFVFGYEEALGYCAGTMVRDKDGITAALLLAELVADLAGGSGGGSPRTVHDRLDELAAEHGAHVTDQWSLRLPGPTGLARVAAVMSGLRQAPPAALDGRTITEVEDLLAGGPLPPSDVVILRLGRARVMVRPSGTEPKLKLYFEAVEPVRDGDVGRARAAAADAVRRLRHAMVAALRLDSDSR
jgi:phosphomannomutase